MYRLQITTLEFDEKPATEAARTKKLDTLREVLVGNSVYPTLSIDEDGGVTAEWCVRLIALEIDCDPDGAMTYAVRLRGHEAAARKCFRKVNHATAAGSS